ncbi:MAG TPA: translocation/assembly module TamB domain-containing protein [Candidatus Eisenbacteria bacterium]|nr:translocation/assembly module TamB domain-containing protein [Candidatus Eisenbacteria bacterium]
MIKKTFLALFLLSAVAASSFAALVATSGGSARVIRWFVGHRLTPARVEIERVTGRLLGTFQLRGVTARGVAGLPAGAEVRIQELGVERVWSPAGTKKVVNGRLLLPYSDPVFFFGELRGHSPDFSVFASRLDVRSLAEAYLKSAKAKKVSGTLRSLEAAVAGRTGAPVITGRFHAVGLRYGPAEILHAAATFRIAPRKKRGRWIAPGEIRIRGGRMRIRGVTVLRLEPSRIRFDGEGGPPEFDLEANALIEDTRIHLRLKGTSDKPDLELRSDPPMNDQRLLIMLATGKKWEGTEKALKEGRVSLGVAREFLDYFFFGGSAGKFADSIGLKELTLRYDEDVEGLEVKKGITRSVDALYSVERPRAEKTGALRQSVGAEVRVNRVSTVALQASKSQGAYSGLSASDEPDDAEAVTVEYKRKF